MKREVVSRSIINILNVKQTYDYERFSTSSMYEELISFGKELYDEDIYNAYQSVILNNKDIISKISEEKEYTLEELNSFLEQLRQFKRTYILKK